MWDDHENRYDMMNGGGAMMTPKKSGFAIVGRASFYVDAVAGPL